MHGRHLPMPIVVLVAVVGLTAKLAEAEPQPGQVFREYLWTNQGGDADGSLRVGGRLDYGGGPIDLPHDFDLEHATRVEVVIEKLLCHDGTRGLAFSVNGHDWIEVPEAIGIPVPQWEYQHHVYPVVAMPLRQLKPGNENQFRMKVSREHPWRWPQNLIYGVHFRVYYDPARKPHPRGRLVAPAAGAVLRSEVELQAESSSPNGRVVQVDFLGSYDGVNLEGDGRYRQWHYHYVKSRLAGHLGSPTSQPWHVTWDTSWIPDQPKPFQVAARITDETRLTCFTESVGGLTFDRGGLSVELCKPYDVPRQWVTRRGEHRQRFRIGGDLNHAVAAQLVWCSWSPGYMEGVYINDRKVFQREGPRYAYYVHRVPLGDLSVLKAGENVLKTGKTPKYDGKTVHGMEVNWPGIMVLIQYRRRDATAAGQTPDGRRILVDDLPASGPLTVRKRRSRRQSSRSDARP